MITLSKIVYKGFRKGEGKRNMTPKMAITGPNGVGKSRIINAVVYGLSGCIGDSKTNESLFSEFSSGSEMSVELHFGGEVIKRGIIETFDKNKTTGKQSVSYEGYAFVYDAEYPDEVKITGKKKVNDYIEKELGIPFEALDFSDFENKSFPEKRKLLNNYITDTDVSLVEAVAYLREGISEIEFVDEMKEKINEAIANIERGDNYKKLADIIDYATRKKSFFFDQKKNTQGAVNTVTILKNEIEGDLNKLVTIEDDIKEVNGRIKGLSEDQYNIRVAVNQKELYSQNIADETSRIVNLKEQLSNCDTTILEGMDTDLLKDKLDLAKIIEERINFEDIPDVLETEAKLEASSELISTLEKDSNKLDFKIALLKGELAEKATNIIAFSERGTCPFTGKACLSGKSDVLDFMEANYNRLLAEYASCELESAEIIERTTEAVKVQRVLGVKYDAIADDFTSEDEKFDDYELQMRSIVDQHLANERKVQHMREMVPEIKEQIVAAENKLAFLFEKEVTESKDPEKVAKAMLVAETQLADLILKKSQLEEKRSAYELQKKSVIAAQEAEYQYMAWSFIQKKLGVNGLLGELIKKATGPFVDEMNEALRFFGDKETFFIDTINDQGKEILRFGLVRNGERINYNTLSNSEGMTVAICMTYVFQTIKGCPYKIIMLDEFSNYDRGRMEIMLKGLEALPVNQVIICGEFSERVSALTEKVKGIDFEVLEYVE